MVVLVVMLVLVLVVVFVLVVAGAVAAAAGADADDDAEAWGYTTLLTSQVISVSFYSEGEKAEKFYSEALISA